MDLPPQLIARNHRSGRRFDPDGSVLRTGPREVSCAQWREHLADLLADAAAGDEQAFMRFYDHTSGVAYGVALRRSADPVAAREATRALYLQAWQQVHGYAGSGLSPLAWLLSSELPHPVSTAC